MNRSDIIHWLETYTPIETELQSFYLTHHHPAPEETLFSLIQKHHGLANDINNLFHNIDPTINQNVFPTDGIGRSQYPEQLWMKQNHHISIRKHPRYFPLLKHTHNFIEIAYVYRGNCTQTFYFDQEYSEQTMLSTGTLCIIPPGLEHTIAVFDDSIVINILIRTTTMKHALTDLVVGNHSLFDFFTYTLYENASPNYILFDTSNDETIADIIVDMMLELCEDKPYNQKVVHLMLGLFFTYLQRDHSDSVQFSKYASAGIDYIPQIFSYMQEHYRTTSVEDIAKHFFLSRSYLSKVFKTNTNTTIIQALQQVRMQHACDYLENTQLSVQNICEAVGYGDVTFFIRVFKKTFHVTPLQYRKQHQM